MKPLKTPQDIYFFPVNYKNGKNTNFGDKKQSLKLSKKKL